MLDFLEFEAFGKANEIEVTTINRIGNQDLRAFQASVALTRVTNPP